MAELTLKDESVIDIGQAVGERVQSIAQTGTSTAMVPAGGAIAPAVVAEPIVEAVEAEPVVENNDMFKRPTKKVEDVIDLSKPEIQDAEMVDDED